MQLVKNPPANAGDARDVGLIPGLERSSREGNGNVVRYSCLENSTDRDAWQAVHSPRGCKEWDTHTHTEHVNMDTCKNVNFNLQFYHI